MATTLLTGCIVPDQRHYVGGVVLVAPPAPREEIIGAPSQNLKTNIEIT